MTAGAGPAHYRRLCVRCALPPALLAACVVWVVLALASGGHTSRAYAAPVRPYTPAWATFQGLCEQGPAPGEGSTPQACVCWERNLQAAMILPSDAVNVLDAAQTGGGQAYTVLENIGNYGVQQAADGCGLYAQGSVE